MLRRARTSAAAGTVGEVVAVAVVLALSVVVYTRFSSHRALTRDPAIYVYAGQRLAHGVPPYVSIVDPKGPGATFLTGAGVAIARASGHSDLATIRLIFLLAAIVTAVGTYLLGRLLWGSVGAGLVTAAVFLSFRAFAQDATDAPDALIPGIACQVLSLALLVRRRWFWGGFVAALAFTVWQPLLIYVAVAVGAAMWTERGRRVRSAALALAGAAIPIVAVAAYFAFEGALRAYLDFAFVQPEQRPSYLGIVPTLHLIAHVADGALGRGVILFWVGLALVVVLAVARLVHGPRAAFGDRLRDPLVCVVLPTFLAVGAFSISYFGQYPHLYPLLPYAALGIGGALAAALRFTPNVLARRVVLPVAALGASALMVASIVWFADNPGDDRGLAAQRAQACALNVTAGRGLVYAVGDPTPLVLTHRVNPDPYIFLQGGILKWKLDRLDGGFEGWERQIVAARPRVIVVDGLTGPARFPLRRFLVRRYAVGHLGSWLLYLPATVKARAIRRGVQITKDPYLLPGYRDELARYVPPRCT